MVKYAGPNAFVVDSDVMWFIYIFWANVVVIDRLASGSITIFRGVPSKLLSNLHAPDADILLQELIDWPLYQKGVENMGIFSRSSKVKPKRPMSYLEGDAPDFSVPGGKKTYFTITEERRRREGIASADIASFAEAQYAIPLGLNEEEPFLAWGPIWVSLYGVHKVHEGTGVVTPDSLIIWWQPKRRGLIHSFQANHAAHLSVEEEGPTAANFRWDTGVYADDNGKFMVGDPAFYIAARWCDDDGDANRRALNFYYTLADRILN